MKKLPKWLLVTLALVLGTNLLTYAEPRICGKRTAQLKKEFRKLLRCTGYAAANNIKGIEFHYNINLFQKLRSPKAILLSEMIYRTYCLGIPTYDKCFEHPGECQEFTMSPSLMNLQNQSDISWKGEFENIKILRKNAKKSPALLKTTDGKILRGSCTRFPN